MTAAAPSALDLGTLAVVGALVLALGAIQWWLRGRVARPEGPLRVLATRALGAKRAVALIEVDEERFLLGLTDVRIECLGRLGRARTAAPLRRAGGVGGAS